MHHDRYKPVSELQCLYTTEIPLESLLVPTLLLFKANDASRSLKGIYMWLCEDPNRSSYKFTAFKQCSLLSTVLLQGLEEGEQAMYSMNVLSTLPGNNNTINSRGIIISPHPHLVL